MSAAAAGPSPSDEQALDDILASIENTVDDICAKAVTGRISKTPSPAPERIKKTRMAFQALSEEKLLEESREDNKPLVEKSLKKAKKPSGLWPFRRAAMG